MAESVHSLIESAIATSSSFTHRGSNVQVKSRNCGHVYEASSAVHVVSENRGLPTILYHTAWQFTVSPMNQVPNVWVAFHQDRHHTVFKYSLKLAPLTTDERISVLY
jgi:hypothetical protein